MNFLFVCSLCLFICFLSHEHILFFLSLFQRLSTDNFAINFIIEGIFFLVKCLQAVAKLFLILVRLVCCRELCYLLLLLCTSVAKTLLAFCNRVTSLAFSDARHVTNLLQKSQIIAN